MANKVEDAMTDIARKEALGAVALAWSGRGAGHGSIGGAVVGQTGHAQRPGGNPAISWSTALRQTAPRSPTGAGTREHEGGPASVAGAALAGRRLGEESIRSTTLSRHGPSRWTWTRLAFSSIRSLNRHRDRRQDRNRVRRREVVRQHATVPHRQTGPYRSKYRRGLNHAAQSRLWKGCYQW